MKFIDVIMASRRREQSQTSQERAVRAATYPPHRNVVAAPQRPPVKSEAKR